MIQISAQRLVAAAISQETQNEMLSKTLREFHAQIKTDEDAIEELARKQQEIAPVVCPNLECGSSDISRPPGSRVAKCNCCHTKIRIFAKTPFRNMRVPRAWVLAIRLKENGVQVSASQFARLVDIAISSAGSILKSLMSVISRCYDETAIQVHSGHFMEIFSKRSNQTPAEGHPSAEQEDYERKFDPDGVITDRALKMEESSIIAMPQGWMELANGNETEFDYINDAAILARPGESKRQESGSEPKDIAADDGEDAMSCTKQSPLIDDNDTNLEKVAAKIYQLLNKDRLTFDQICDRSAESLGLLFRALNYLIDLGLVRRGSGGWIYKVDPKNEERPKPGRGAFRPLAVIDFVFFVRQKFQGISRKYLQLYVSAYWCYLDRRRWGPDSLMKECFAPENAGSTDELNGFVSPLLVQFMAA